MNTKKGPKKAKKEPRVKIPAPIQMKLWMKSGGRCQFTSCPKYLWEEGLTLNEGNYAHIAHIVAQSPDGPRGDKVKSAQLAGDYENLMLMCFEHHKLIDSPATWMKFPVGDLRKMKKSHEEFIAALHKTPKQNIRTVIRFRANIQGDQLVDIPFSMIRDRMFQEESSVPKDDKGVEVDLARQDPPKAVKEWQDLRESLRVQLSKGLQRDMDGQSDCHLSVFGMGPIPLLMELGRQLPNTLPIDIYQRSRSDQTWVLGRKITARLDFNVTIPENSHQQSADVVLKLSVSGLVSDESVKQVMGKDLPTYSIQLAEGVPGMVMADDAVKKFGVEFQKVLSAIQEAHGHVVNIHLFPALPNALAVQCGVALLQKAHPPILVYDYDKALGGFQSTFTI